MKTVKNKYVKNIIDRITVRNIIILVIYIALLYFQYHMIFEKGLYDWARKAGIGRLMIYELLVFGVPVFVNNLLVKSKVKYFFSAYFLLLAAHLHQTIVAFIGALIYAVILYLVGYLVLSLMKGKEQMGDDLCIIASFCMGLCSVIIIVSVLSVLKIYSVHNIYYVLGTLVLLCLILRGRNIFGAIKGVVKKKPESELTAMIFKSIAEISMFIQVARVSIQGDYDGKWYGLRSLYVLAMSNKGIYEDPKLMGFTYLYPKGTEIVMLPLTKFNSWNYQFLFHAFVVLAITYVCWCFIRDLAGKKQAYILSSIIVTLPAIMNMAMTVKSDLMTSLFQIAGIYFIYRFRKDKVPGYLYISLSLLLVSYCFKITTLLFTSSIVLAILPFISVKKIKASRTGFLSLVIGIITTGFVYARNILFTGVPILFYVGGIIDKLGIKLKYPYAIPDKMLGDTSVHGSILKKIFTNMYGYFVSPTGDEFAHVLIAWGTSIPVILLLLAGILFFLDKDKKKYFKGWFWFLGVMVASMIFGLAMIGQADGNYFMLFYALFIIVPGSYIIKRYKDIFLVVYISAIFNIYFVLYSNWSWAYGFTEMKAVNNGYVNQVQIYDEALYNKVGKKIYNIIHEPDGKVVAMTWKMDDIVGIHGTSQLWIDIVRGNLEVLKGFDIFHEYLVSSGFKYIYVNPSDTYEGMTEMQYLTGLIQVGGVKKIVYGKGGAVLVLNDKLDASDQEKMDKQLSKLIRYLDKKHNPD